MLNNKKSGSVPKPYEYGSLGKSTLMNFNSSIYNNKSSSTKKENSNTSGTKIGKKIMGKVTTNINVKDKKQVKNAKAKINDLFSIKKQRQLTNNKVSSQNKNLKTKEKNPTTAKILSIIPGAGYLYAGHRGSALTSLFINSLLAYATFTSIKKGNYGVAGIMGFFSISFYIGNITGASRCVTRYNKKTRNDIISTMERRNNIFY
jgi:hypothetical protein